MDPLRIVVSCGIGTLLGATISAAGVPPQPAQGKPQPFLPDEVAYNPIPSPNGEYVAFVRSGRRSPLEGGSGGFGRSNFRSEVALLRRNDARSRLPRITSGFLAGWIGDGTLLSYRDGRAHSLHLSGEQLGELHLPNGNSQYGERVAYLPASERFVWARDEYIRGERFTTIQSSTGILARTAAIRSPVLLPSPHGTAILVCAGLSRGPIRVLSLRDRQWSDLGQTRVHPDSLWDWLQSAWHPWFRDSQRLALISERNLVVANATTGRRTTLITLPNTAGLPTPSPDGRLVAVIEQRQGSAHGIRKPLHEYRLLIATVTFPGRVHMTTPWTPSVISSLHWADNQELFFDQVDTAPPTPLGRLYRLEVTSPPSDP